MDPLPCGRPSAEKGHRRPHRRRVGNTVWACGIQVPDITRVCAYPDGSKRTERSEETDFQGVCPVRASVRTAEHWAGGPDVNRACVRLRASYAPISPLERRGTGRGPMTRFRPAAL